MTQLTKEQAMLFYDQRCWEPLTLRQRAEFQMMQDKLCMPFGVFHEAVEKTLGRPVFTHEFGLNRDGLTTELFDGAPPPSLEDIIKLLPQDKTIVLVGT